MNRAVGKYKDQEIKISALYLCGTYDGLLLGRLDDKWRNIELVNVKIDRESQKLFGAHVPYCIVDYHEIEYSKRLPPEIVFARLDCGEVVKKGDGSHLILVWLQDSSRDPFAEASEKLKTINWEEHAEDFEY